MDIRNFFGPKSGSSSKPGPTSKKNDEPKSKSTNRPKPVVSDTSSEDESEKSKRRSSEKKKSRPCNTANKKRQVLSDSDDEFIESSVGKKKTKKDTNGHSKETKKVEQPKLKPVKADDFFAQTSSKLPKLPKIPKIEKKPVEPSTKSNKDEPKTKSPEKKRKTPDEDFFDDDPLFDSLVQDVDFNQELKAAPSPVKKAKLSEGETKPEETLSQKLASKLKKEEKTKEEKKKKEEKLEDEKHKKEIAKIEKLSPTKIKSEKPVAKAPLSQAYKDPVPKVSKDVKPVAQKISPKKEIASQSQSQESTSSQPADGELFQLWVDKYKPTSSKTIIGQQGDSSNMRKLTNWIKNWSNNNSGSNKKAAPRPPPWNSGADNGFWAKAALLSGPPGVGKTTTAYLVAKELGYDVMELNASDTRSKKQLGAIVSDAVNSQSLSTTSVNRILLMDEVDGMAGNEDRGGMAELIHLIKNSKIPVVCMCNDRNHPKIRSLANHCFDLRFQRPRVEQIRAAMMSICFKEKLKMSPDALNELITGCNQDIRQVLHHLSMLKAKDFSDSVDGKLTQEEAKEEAERSKKTSIKIGPWDVCRKVFSASEQQGMTLSDKSDLFFHDYSIGPLFVQENYLSAMPHIANKDPKKAILLASKAADSICQGDLVEKLIRSQNSWSLLPVEAMFASVLPGEYMSGHVQGQIQFPNWLGKNSKQNKMDRILQELQMHTRLSAGMSKRALNLDFIQHLRDAILRPMIKEGSDGVADSVQVMNQYSLLREDLDNLLEIAQWPDRADPMKNIESKVKAAFTRTYNKEVFLPYAVTLGSINKRASAALASSGDLLVEDEEEDVGDEEEKDDIESDAMIKAKKPKATKAAAESSVPKPGRGGKAGAAGRGRGGRGKK